MQSRKCSNVSLEHIILHSPYSFWNLITALSSSMILSRVLAFLVMIAVQTVYISPCLTLCLAPLKTCGFFFFHISSWIKFLALYRNQSIQLVKILHCHEYNAKEIDLQNLTFAQKVAISPSHQTASNENRLYCVIKSTKIKAPASSIQCIKHSFKWQISRCRGGWWWWWWPCYVLRPSYKSFYLCCIKQMICHWHNVRIKSELNSWTQSTISLSWVSQEFY